VKKKYKKLLWNIAGALVASIIVMPVIIGFLIKHHYDELIAFYNSQGNLHVTLTSYERHWFSATAKLSVRVNHPLLEKILPLINATDIKLPETLDFTIYQHIQYGPILYRQMDKSLALELAYMYSAINLTPELSKVIQQVNIFEPAILMIDNLSFSGKFERNIRSSGMRMVFPDAQRKLEFYGLNAYVTIWPQAKRIKADVVTNDILMANGNLAFTIPDAEFVCDQRLSANDLWVGNSSLSLPKFFLQKPDKSSIWFMGFTSIGSLSEADGLLSGSTQFDVDKIQADNQIIGPITLHASVHNLNAKAMGELAATYKESLATKQSLLTTTDLISILPSLLNDQSSFTVDNFQARTPQGDLLFKSEMKWPDLEESAAPTLVDTLHHTAVLGSLRVASPLMNNLMHVAAEFSSIQLPAASTPEPQADKQKRILEAQHQNELLIGMLIQNQQLPEVTGEKLLVLAKKNISLEEYANTLNAMAVGKEISAAVMQMLRLQYTSIQFINMPAEQRRIHTEKAMQTQLTEWIQNGYVLHEQNDYLVSVELQNGIIRINGKNL
jgi:uncharacterized protein YdgA (DUF945 family)